MAVNWTNSDEQKSAHETKIAKDMGIYGEIVDNKVTDSLKPKELPK